jgi:hypothetical protein
VSARIAVSHRQDCAPAAQARYSMIPKSRFRFSEKITLYQKNRIR